MLDSVLTFLLLASPAGINTPCQGVDRSLPIARKQGLAPIIAKQVKLEKVAVIKSFRFKDWYIIHIGTYVSDDMFLFYHGDPVNHMYVTDWGGAAGIDETDEIKAWVIENAKGIPDSLAACFAWHVTKDRE